MSIPIAHVGPGWFPRDKKPILVTPLDLGRSSQVRNEYSKLSKPSTPFIYVSSHCGQSARRSKFSVASWNLLSLVENSGDIRICRIVMQSVSQDGM